MSWSETLGQVMQTRPILAYGASFLGGVVATASPCILASIPLVIGFVGGLIVDLHGQTIRDLLPAVSDTGAGAPHECGSGPVWSPDGRRIAIIDPLTPNNGRLLIFDPGASAPRVLAAEACAIVGWSPAGLLSSQ